jgi:hypothetical protein
LAWRQAAFARIADLGPELVVLSNDRDFKLSIDGARVPGAGHEDIWIAGLEATIRRLTSLGSKVVVIGDTPTQHADPPDCLSEHLDDAAVCSTPFAKAVSTARLDEERTSTEAAGGTFIDPTPWLCFTDRCPSVVGRFLVYRDTHHLTATYSRALAHELERALPAIP